MYGFKFRCVTVTFNLLGGVPDDGSEKLACPNAFVVFVIIKVGCADESVHPPMIVTRWPETAIPNLRTVIVMVSPHTTVPGWVTS